MKVRLKRILALMLAGCMAIATFYDVEPLKAKADEKYVLNPNDDASLSAVEKDTQIPNGSYGTSGFFYMKTEADTGKNNLKMKRSDVASIELPKNEYGYIEFTVTASGSCTVSVGSTGNSNTSDIALKKSDGSFVKPDGESNSYASVTGMEAKTISFSNLSAGTYRIVVPTKERATRIYNIVVNNTGAAVITMTPTPTPTNTPAPTNTPTPRPASATTSELTKLVADAAESECVYVSPNGKTTAAGTKADPMDLQTAIDKAEAGKPIILLAGTYKPANFISIARGNNGTADSMKVLMSERGERAVLDFSSSKGTEAGFTLAGDYWYIGGIDIVGAPNYSTGGSSKGAKGMKIAGSHNIIDSCNAYNNHNTGFQVSRLSSSDAFSAWPSYNLIVNCDSHDNKDDPCEDADGFAAKLTCGEGNVFLGCLSYCNIDDGWDLYSKSETGAIGVVTIKNCVAMKNGWLSDGSGSGNGDGNGFKLGSKEHSTPHVVENSIALGNLQNGFTSNGNGGIKVYNCTSYKNGKAGYMYRNDSKPLNAEGVGLISLGNVAADGLSDFASSLKTALNFLWDKKTSKNSNGDTISESYFVSVDMSTIPGRDANYNLDMQGLMEIKNYAGTGAVLAYDVYNFTTKSASGKTISGWTSVKSAGAGAQPTEAAKPTAAPTSTPTPTTTPTTAPTEAPKATATPTLVPTNAPTEAAATSTTPTVTPTEAAEITATPTETAKITATPTEADKPAATPTAAAKPTLSAFPTPTRVPDQQNPVPLKTYISAFLNAFLVTSLIIAAGFVAFYVFRRKKK